MLFAKSALAVAFLALGNIVAAAETPACLLSAVGSQPNPADLKAVCVTNGDEVQSTIQDLCGENATEALQYFSSTCSDGGYKITIKTPATTTASGTSSTAEPSSTSGTSSDSNTSSGAGSTSTPSPSETPSSGSSDRQVSAAAFAAVVFVGFAATL